MPPMIVTHNRKIFRTPPREMRVNKPHGQAAREKSRAKKPVITERDTESGRNQ